MLASSARVPLEILADGLCHIVEQHGPITKGHQLSTVDMAIKLERYLIERGWTIVKQEHAEEKPQ